MKYLLKEGNTPIAIIIKRDIPEMMHTVRTALMEHFDAEVTILSWSDEGECIQHPDQKVQAELEMDGDITKVDFVLTRIWEY